MFSFTRLISASAKPTITIFHNTNSKLSHHLLSRLIKHESNYLLDVRSNKLPLYRTYAFIHEQCMNIHPQNMHSFEKVFPALLAPLHLFCDVAVKKELKQKQFVQDLDLVLEHSYLDRVATHLAEEMVPFVVDWNNQLVAVNDDGLDRIMHNYYTCGIQKSSMTHDNTGLDRVESPIEPAPRASNGDFVTHSQAAAMMCAVHPHVADFADLF